MRFQTGRLLPSLWGQGHNNSYNVCLKPHLDLVVGALHMKLQSIKCWRKHFHASLGLAEQGRSCTANCLQPWTSIVVANRPFNWSITSSQTIPSTSYGFQHTKNNPSGHFFSYPLNIKVVSQPLSAWKESN